MTSSLISFEWALFRATWQASLLIGIVLLLQKLLGRHIGGHGRYVLWIVVIARLLLPVAPQSRWSLFNLAQVRPAHHQTAIVMIHETDGPSALPSALAPAAGKAVAAVRRPIAATAPVARSIDWRSIAPVVIGAVWACGLIVLSANVLAACWWLRRVERTLDVVTDSHVLQIVHSARAALALRSAPRVLVGEPVKTPAVVGVLRPALWLPARVISECDDEQIRLIILHELAHMKRNDVLGNWLIAAATIAHWFNPLVWLVAMRMRSDRELACDELVLSVSSHQDAQTYGRTLLRLIEILAAAPAPRLRQPQVVGILESTAPLKRRVRMIARFNRNALLRRSSRWIWTFALLLGLGCTTLTDAVRGDDTNKPARPQPQTPVKKDPAIANASKESPNWTEHPQDNEELERCLQRVLPQFKFDNIGFADVVEYLRDAIGANIVVEWRALENAGIDKNALVSINMQRVVAEQALDHILSDVSGTGPRLDYTIDQGAIVISTADQLARRGTTITYDVTDLIVSPAGQALTGADYDKKFDELIRLIQTTIAPDTWHDNGGSIGSLQRYNNKLLILTTLRIQQQVQKLLERLREEPTTQPRPLEQ